MQEKYTIEDILKIYRQYFLPTIKEKFPAKFRVTRTTLSICKALGYDVISEEPLIIGKETFEELKICFKNRNLQIADPELFFDSNQASDFLGISREAFKNLDRKQNLKKATIIKNTFYYYKKDIYEIMELQKKLYDMEKIKVIVLNKLNIKISSTVLRSYIRALRIEQENPYCKKFIYIKKEDIKILLNHIEHKYKKKTINEYPDYISLILNNCDYEFLNKTNSNFIDLHDQFLNNEINIHYIRFQDYRKYIIKYCKLNNIKIYLIDCGNKKNYKLYLKVKDINIIKKDHSKNLYFVFENEKKREVLLKCSENEFLKNLINKNKATIILGKNIPENIMKKFTYYIYKKEIYFEKSLIDKIKAMSNEIVGINSIARKYSKSYATIKSIMNRLNIEEFLYKGCSISNRPSILKKYVCDIERELKKDEEFRKINDRYNLYEYLTNDYNYSTKLVKTYELFEEFRLKRMSSNKSRLIVNALAKLHKYITVNFNKEIIHFTDQEIEFVISNIKETTTISEFLKFVEYSKKYNCTYNGVYKEKKITKNPLEAYDKNQWIEFGKILFGFNKEMYELMLEKSVKIRGNACIWLFCCLHYVACWRKQDYYEIPTPDLEILNININKLKIIIENNQFTQEMAQKIINNVKLKIDYNDYKPKKTEGRNKVALKFEVSTSYVYIIGMLLALCEIHRRQDCSKWKNNKLMTEIASNVEQHHKFFGECYYEIFGQTGFTNIRANKTYEKNIILKSQENTWGMGIQLASIARSHNLNKALYSNTTEVYLKDVNKDGDVDEIMSAIFERGIFGFIPYQLLILLKGEGIRKLKIKEQNKLLIELNLKPSEIEKYLKLTEINIEKYRKIINEIGNLNNEEMMEGLKKICLGLAPSKMEYSQCFLKVINKQCEKIGRTSCLGCDYSIPEVYILLKLNAILFECIEKMRESKELFEIKKWSYILINKYMRVLNNAILILGKDRVDAFIDRNLLKEEINCLIKNNKLLLE